MAEADWVAIAVSAEAGTRQGTCTGVEATGEPAKWTAPHFWKILDGQSTEHFGSVSLFEMHKMIGSHDSSSTRS